MSSLVNGINTSAAEVQGISAHGLWLWVREKEYFLSYEDYPWFANAKVQDVFHVQLLHGCHLYWPELDVDLDIDTLEHPEAYPLRSKVLPRTATT